MIDTIRGTIEALFDHGISVDIGPIGFLMCVPNPTQFKKGDNIALYVYMHWNSEQGPTLYGFLTQLERSVFVLVISCSGIGPKKALVILSDLGVQEFLHAVQMADDRTLSKVSGIGPKKAEQIIVQLKHKVVKLISSGVDLGDDRGIIQWHEVTQALESLNYSRMEVTRTMTYLKKSYAVSEISFDQLLRHALSYLNKQT